jgi:hypothetical protein
MEKYKLKAIFVYLKSTVGITEKIALFRHYIGLLKQGNGSLQGLYIQRIA